MDTPKITIGIPTYNQSNTLADTINSALNQTVPCEIIVVNDGSTDLTKQVLYEFEDKVKIIHQTNRGLPAARNTAIMNATGEWFIPLDSDDILEPNYVERVLTVIQDVPEADVIAPSFKTFGMQESAVLLQMRPTLEDFKSGNRIGYCSAIRKSALLEVGGYSPKMVFGYEDMALWVNLLSRNKFIVTIPEYLWNYRTKPDSMITISRQHHEELMAQICKDNPAFRD